MTFGKLLIGTAVSVSAVGFCVGVYKFILPGIATQRPTAALVSQATLPDTETAQAMQVDDEEWKEEQGVDPMTDAVIHSARRHYQGQRNRISVAAKCVNHQKLYYQIKTFDAQGDPVSMLTEPDAAMAILVKNGIPAFGPVIKYAVRMDSQKAQTGYYINPKYGHVLTIGGSLASVDTSKMATASQLLIRLPTEGGYETITVDQGVPGIFNVVSDCSAELRAAVGLNQPVPVKPKPRLAEVGECETTTIKLLASRLEGVPESGSAVTYADGVYGVSYEVEPAVAQSRIGDPVKLCLTTLPQNCPTGDDRGRWYAATNLRTGGKWDLPDAEHSCGGA